MNTKDKVLLKLLLIILILFGLWISTLILWLINVDNYNKLLGEHQINMSTTNDNQFTPEIITEQVNYMSKEEKTVINDCDKSEDNKIYLGKFKITHYCACKKCCGANAQGITASGKRVEEGKTIAVDASVIKMGSKVLIDGYGEYEAQDTGSAIKGNVIDVYVADHNQALKMGVVYRDVYLLRGE